MIHLHYRHGPGMETGKISLDKIPPRYYPISQTQDSCKTKPYRLLYVTVKIVKIAVIYLIYH